MFRERKKKRKKRGQHLGLFIFNCDLLLWSVTYYIKKDIMKSVIINRVRISLLIFIIINWYK
ncbi:hypothetical protein EDC94DRAFT_627796 [Helicostylum pulchrum]|nr:hypothetical protein EDC94DRAFT_627796 [Helicostylum pulchrum]